MTIQTDPVPLQIDEDGAIRVGGTRITLDLVVEEYENGSTPEDIVRGYDVLQLADVYAVIAYYLRHRAEVAERLASHEIEAEELRRTIELAQPPRPGFRQELLARKARMEKGLAPPGQ